MTNLFDSIESVLYDLADDITDFEQACIVRNWSHEAWQAGLMDAESAYCLEMEVIDAKWPLTVVW